MSHLKISLAPPLPPTLITSVSLTKIIIVKEKYQIIIITKVIPFHNHNYNHNKTTTMKKGHTNSVIHHRPFIAYGSSGVITHSCLLIINPTQTTRNLLDVITHPPRRDIEIRSVISRENLKRFSVSSWAGIRGHFPWG